eukprot:3362957-Pyramimonas_sp.AAC.1
MLWNDALLVLAPSDFPSVCLRSASAAKREQNEDGPRNRKHTVEVEPCHRICRVSRSTGLASVENNSVAKPHLA